MFIFPAHTHCSGYTSIVKHILVMILILSLTISPTIICLTVEGFIANFRVLVV